MSEPGESPEPVEVPYAALSSEALQGLIESYVLREGTDYGEQDYTLAQKTDQVLAQIRRGQARIFYDPHTETVTIEVSVGAAPRPRWR